MSKLNSLLKGTIRWLLPSGIADLLMPYKDLVNVQFMFSRMNQALLAKNAALRNQHQGERVFLLATGPSIKKQTLRPLQHENCIALSNFYVHPDFQLIKPRFYVLPLYHEPIRPAAWEAWMR